AYTQNPYCKRLQVFACARQSSKNLSVFAAQEMEAWQNLIVFGIETPSFKHYKALPTHKTPAANACRFLHIYN
ncbi:MAG: hypothetical protein ABI091_20360, partial [Ferruginibacter sp.]